MENIFEYAMQMEKDGEDYYRQLAQKIDNNGMKTILTMLADEEVKHYNAIEKIKKQKTQIAESEILTDAKNVFVQIKESGDSFDFDINEAELYKRARDIEKKSRDFYMEKAGEVTETYQKELFLKLADEEQKHYVLLDNIIEFVSRPEQWLENAEFFHLEEY
ncbi:MAG: ferritin family protein [Sedimentisphaerales bacterium]|nr:ferritin family protein [Sedimentisphaerales bacterium]